MCFDRRFSSVFGCNSTSSIDQYGNFAIGLWRILHEIGIGGYYLGPHGSTDYVGTGLDFGHFASLELPYWKSWSGKYKLYEGFAIFTDCSWGTGEEVYLEDLDIRFRFRYCSIFLAEVLGMLMAVELLRGTIAGCSKVTTNVGSHVALRALRGCFVNSKLVDHC